MKHLSPEITGGTRCGSYNADSALIKCCRSVWLDRREKTAQGKSYSLSKEGEGVPTPDPRADEREHDYMKLAEGRYEFSH
jgi:hypothetical protein